MGIKNQSWEWRKGKQAFFSVPNVKKDFARELIVCGDIKVPAKDWILFIEKSLGNI